MKLFVSGLPMSWSPRDFKEMFELYGTVVSAKLVMNFETRQSKGFGFVEYSSVAEARETMSLLNGKTIEGKTLVIKPAEETEEKSR